MKITVDSVADALYLSLSDDAAVNDTRQVAPGIVVDYGGDGQVVGIEILSVSKRTSKIDLSHVAFESDGQATRVAEAPPGYGKASS